MKQIKLYNQKLMDRFWQAWIDRVTGKVKFEPNYSVLLKPNPKYTKILARLEEKIRKKEFPMYKLVQSNKEKG